MFGKSNRELVSDLLLMGGWAIYASGFLKRLIGGGGLVELGQVTAVTVFAALFLLRRPAQRSGTTWETLLALAGTFLPAAAWPGAGNTGNLHWLGEVIQVAGLTGMVAAAISLGRSFGIAPADRGLRTTGLYAWVRHPLYAMEISYFAGYLVANPSWWNLVILIADTTVQLLRALREERILTDYAAYASRVRWRLLPLVW
jgi:protein-S-isoprenylcysteine O-methyltransferase Ste14